MDTQPPQHIKINIIAPVGLIAIKVLQYYDLYSLSKFQIELTVMLV